MADVNSYDIKNLFNVENRIEEIKKNDSKLLELIPDIDEWFIAGKIVAYLLQFGKSLITIGESLYDAAETITEKLEEIKKLSSKEIMFAFPINISLDDCAAHYTAQVNDETEFEKNIVKLDIGISVNGAIGDSAITIDLTGENQNLVDASHDALMNGIATITPEQTLGNIGKEIERTILSKGLMPIRNLSGHMIERYNLHAGANVPNYDSREKQAIGYGNVFAVEPFATNGAGMIENKGVPNIFMLISNKKSRSQITRSIMEIIDTYKKLPFSKLNLTLKEPQESEGKVNFAIRDLRSMGAIMEFAPLMEIDNGLVSQAEHTIIIGSKAFITTKLD